LSLGLHWTEEELEAYQVRKYYEEKRNIEEQGRLGIVAHLTHTLSSPISVTLMLGCKLVSESDIDNFDPLAVIEDPAPTFRAEMER
jgi:hypothetical protein